MANEKKAKWSVRSDRTTQSVTVTYNPKEDARVFAVADVPEGLLKYLATVGLKNVLEDAKAGQQTEAEGWAAVEKRWNTLMAGLEVSSERGVGGGGALKARAERAEQEAEAARAVVAQLQAQMAEMAQMMEELRAKKAGKATVGGGK